jgi:hypothetical protein
MDQAVQLIGAVLILTAFVLAQQRRMATDSVVYLALNAVGAALLAVVARGVSCSGVKSWTETAAFW